MTVSLNLNIHNKKIIILKSSHENTPHCVCWDVLIEKENLSIVYINPFIPEPDLLDTYNSTTLIRNRLANLSSLSTNHTPLEIMELAKYNLSIKSFAYTK